MREQSSPPPDHYLCIGKHYLESGQIINAEALFRVGITIADHDPDHKMDVENYFNSCPNPAPAEYLIISELYMCLSIAYFEYAKSVAKDKGITPEVNDFIKNSQNAFLNACTFNDGHLREPRFMDNLKEEIGGLEKVL